MSISAWEGTSSLLIATSSAREPATRPNHTAEQGAAITAAHSLTRAGAAQQHAAAPSRKPVLVQRAQQRRGGGGSGAGDRCWPSQPRSCHPYAWATHPARNTQPWGTRMTTRPGTGWKLRRWRSGNLCLL